jgi:hypothetical protein
MKGKISLKEFISQVSTELREGQSSDPDKAFFELTGVTLEVSFTLDSTATGSGKFLVVEVGGEAKSSQVHKVTLELQPIKKSTVNPERPFDPRLPTYAPMRNPSFDKPGHDLPPKPIDGSRFPNIDGVPNFKW